MNKIYSFCSIFSKEDFIDTRVKIVYLPDWIPWLVYSRFKLKYLIKKFKFFKPSEFIYLASRYYIYFYLIKINKDWILHKLQKFFHKIYLINWKHW